MSNDDVAQRWTCLFDKSVWRGDGTRANRRACVAGRTMCFRLSSTVVKSNKEQNKTEQLNYDC